MSRSAGRSVAAAVSRLLAVTLLPAILLAGCGDDGGTEPVQPFVGSISGTVVHAETGSPVAGATVTTEPATSAVQTDGSGSYRIEGISAGEGSAVPDGAFEVRAVGAGFSDAATTVTLTRSSPDARVDIELPVTLASVASLQGLPVGAAVAINPLRDENRYGEVLALEFNSVTPENAMKFGPLRPSQGQFDFDNADRIVGFAEANDMRIHGHVLLWHNQLPGWLTDGGFTREELLEILKEHITTVVERYAGQIASWDVVNEVVDWQGFRMDEFWLREVGPEAIDSAFHWAHAADPDAKLYINDFGIEVPGPKVDVLYDLVTDLLDRGVPVHGVGIQGHIVADSPPTGAQLATVLGRFSALGLETRITELDIRLETPASQEDLDRQAAIYGDLVAAAVADPGFAGLTFWGFTDRHSWVPNHAPGYGAALLFDSAYQRKPAYFGVRGALAP